MTYKSKRALEEKYEISASLTNKLLDEMRQAGEDLVGTIIVVGEDGDEFADCPITFQQWKNIVDFQEP